MRATTALVLALLGTSPPAFAESCNLRLNAELPLRQASAIFVQAAIQGQPIPMMLDTGSPLTTIDRGTAEKFGLSLRPDPQVRAHGLGGDLRVSLVTIPDFQLGPQHIKNLTIRSVEGMRSDAKQMRGGLLGQDVLRDYDLELDVRGNRLALYEKAACAHAPPWSEDSMTVPIYGARTGRIYFEIKLNGQALKAELDSGATHTTVSWKGARRLGLAEDSPGMEETGSTIGVDGKPLPNKKYRFDSFEIEGEVIRNPRLRILDFYRSRTAPASEQMLRSQEQAEILLGGDWLRAHRVYVAREAGEMHFTYLGGAVFEK